MLLQTDASDSKSERPWCWCQVRKPAHQTHVGRKTSSMRGTEARRRAAVGPVEQQGERGEKALVVDRQV